MVRDVKLTAAEKCRAAWEKYSVTSTAGTSPEMAWYGASVWAMGTIASDVRKVFKAYGLDFKPNSQAAQLLAQIDHGLMEAGTRIARMADAPKPEPEPEEPQ